MRNSLLPLALLSLTFVACTDKLEKAMDMPAITEKMSVTTGAMSDKVGNTDKNSGLLGTKMTHATGKQIRDEQIKNMDHAESFNMKTDHSTTWVYAFEFQSYTDPKIQDFDSEEYLEGARKDAVLELVKTLAEYTAEGTELDLDSLAKSNQAMNLFAIASVLHRVDEGQKQARKMMGMKTESLLDILTNGLKATHDMNQGKINVSDLTPSQYEVAKEQQKIEHLLLMRFKFLPLVALGRMSQVNDGLLNKVKMLYGNEWTPLLDQELNKKEFKRAEKSEKLYIRSLNAAQLKYLADILDYTLQVKSTLVELGLNPKLDKKVEKIYKNMNLDITKEDLKGGPVILSTEESKFLEQFKKFKETLIQ